MLRQHAEGRHEYNQHIEVGDLVLLRDDLSKHEAREPFIVLKADMEQDEYVIKKFTGSLRVKNHVVKLHQLILLSHFRPGPKLASKDISSDKVTNAKEPTQAANTARKSTTQHNAKKNAQPLQITLPVRNPRVSVKRRKPSSEDTAVDVDTEELPDVTNFNQGKGAPTTNEYSFSRGRPRRRAAQAAHHAWLHRLASHLHKHAWDQTDYFTPDTHEAHHNQLPTPPPTPSDSSSSSPSCSSNPTTNSPNISPPLTPTTTPTNSFSTGSPTPITTPFQTPNPSPNTSPGPLPLSPPPLPPRSNSSQIVMGHQVQDFTAALDEINQPQQHRPRRNVPKQDYAVLHKHGRQ